MTADVSPSHFDAAALREFMAGVAAHYGVPPDDAAIADPTIRRQLSASN